MNGIIEDTSSDANFLVNEKFDFDLPFSPTLIEDDTDGKDIDNDNDDEVFFGPVGFTEQCMSTRVATLQATNDLKPLSPLSGEQVVEIFTEATKIALHIERLSTETSENSLNQSRTSSGKSSISNSHLKLSNCSSSSDHSQFSVGKSSSGASEGKPSISDLIENDNDKENVQPVLECTNEKSKGRRKVDIVRRSKSNDVIPSVSKQQNTPVAKTQRSIPRPGGSRGSSRLPRSKNTGKSLSAFNSPIKLPENGRQNAILKDHNPESILSLASNHSVEKSRRRSLQTAKSTSSQQKTVSSSKTTPATTKNRTSSSQTLTKRNIFRSTEFLSEDGTKEAKSKLPVPEQSKIPGPKPRRRRSSSTSSISSQSSTSSPKSQTAHGQNGQTKSRLPKQIPSTKASLASSLPIGLVRRSKVQENSNDKKPQPVKALPRSSQKSSRNTNLDPPSSHLSRATIRPPSNEMKDDKIPLAATPQPQTSLPVVRRRSSIKRPSTTGKKAGESFKGRNSDSVATDSQTPNKPDGTGRAQSTLPARKTRRSLLPTPGRKTKSPARNRISRSDDPPLLSLSPAVSRKESFDDKSKENENTTDDVHAVNTDSSMTSTQSVDDLLQLDDTVSLISDVVPIQPKPVPQADLIDLSGL